jgi:hypothetical protein
VAIESEAAEIIVEAEAKMRKLLADAAAAGSYDLVVKIASWARSLSELKADIPPDRFGKPETSCSGPASGKASGPSLETEKDACRSSRKGDRLDLSRRKKSAYPKFFRDGDSLVKIGWSKAQRSEYEHKAPLSVLSDLAAAIREAIAKKPILVMESLLPLKSSRDGAEVPSYQVYLCVAWLRERGILQKHGRQGYTVKPKVDLSTKASELFQMLSERRFEHNHN